eukprot:122341_1
MSNEGYSQVAQSEPGASVQAQVPPAYNPNVPPPYNPSAVTPQVVTAAPTAPQVQAVPLAMTAHPGGTGQPIVIQYVQPQSAVGIPQQQLQTVQLVQPYGYHQQVATYHTEVQPLQQANPQIIVQPVRPTQPTPIQNEEDNPCCLYVFAILGFFIPLVGLIGVCVYNCGNGLPPRQARAFQVLCIATALGICLILLLGFVGDS